MTIRVHYDNASYASAFCDVVEQSAVITPDEDLVTCPSCIARLQRMDLMIDRNRSVLAAQRIDWFGEG